MERRSFIRTSSQAILAMPFVNFNSELLHIDPKYFVINVGDNKCTILEDLVYDYEPQDFFSNVGQTEIDSALKNGFSLKKNKIPSPFNLMLVENKDKKILIDTGMGYSEKPYIIGENQFIWKGKLMALLDAINIKGSEITDVVITHFHPDHVGGIYSQNRNLNFPNAIFHIPKVEYQYWFSNEANNQPSYFHLFIDNNIKPLKDSSISFIDHDFQEIFPELIAVNAPGHTKGQIALIIGKEDDQVLFIADAFLHPLHIENLDWQTKYDQNHKIAKMTRHKLTDLAYKNNLRVNAFHFDFPGMGRIVKHKSNWKWVYD